MKWGREGQDKEGIFIVVCCCCYCLVIFKVLGFEAENKNLVLTCVVDILVEKPSYRWTNELYSRRVGVVDSNLRISHTHTD